jgi:signal transduction histidine kinase
MTGESILVVEDDDGHALLTERALRKNGFEVEREATGEGCLRSLFGNEERMVLLDLGLPDMDGLVVLEQIVARSPETPVVLVTGVDDLNVAVQALRKGAWDYVVKRPDLSHLRELSHVIRRNQDRRRLVKERNLYRSVLSHDIKNPLNIIFNYADMVGEEAHLRQESRMFLQRIKDNASSILNLINNFIEVTRIEGGKMQLDRRPLAFGPLLRQIVERQTPLAAAKGISLSLQLAPNPPVVLAEEGSMDRIVTNLVSNAIKFTPPGGLVGLETLWKESTFSIRVTDTGRGIPADEVPVVFGKFRRAREAASTEGSGLGLFIVKALVEGHGGRIDVESEIGKGTTFTIHLPVLEEDAESEPRASNGLP